MFWTLRCCYSSKATRWRSWSPHLWHIQQTPISQSVSSSSRLSSVRLYTFWQNRHSDHLSFGTIQRHRNQFFEHSISWKAFAPSCALCWRLTDLNYSTRDCTSSERQDSRCVWRSHIYLGKSKLLSFFCPMLLSNKALLPLYLVANYHPPSVASFARALKSSRFVT